MGSILKFFDFAHANSSRTLFGGPRHSDGHEAPRNSLEFPMGISQSGHIDLEDIPVKLQSNKKNHIPTESLVEKFIDEEMLNSKSTRSCGIGDASLSVGMKRSRADKNASFLSFESDYKKSRDFMLRYDSSFMSPSSSHYASLKQAFVLDSTKNLRMTKPQRRQHPQEEQLQKFKKEFEAWQASKSWKHSKALQLDDDREHFEGNNRVIPRENLHKGKQNRDMESKRISNNGKARESRNNFLTNKLESNTPQGYRFQHEVHKGKRFQYNLKEDMPLRRPRKAANEKWDISSPTAKIVVLKPISRPWLTAPEIPEDEDGIEDILREVKERLRLGIQDQRKFRNSTTARENFTKTFFSRITPMYIAQNLEAEIGETDSKNFRTTVVQSEPTRTDSFEYIDRDKRRILAERLKNVLKNEGDVHCPMPHKGSSGTSVMEKEGIRWSESTNKGKKVKCCGERQSIIESATHSLGCEDEELSPRLLLRSNSAPASRTAFRRLLVEDEQKLAGTHKHDSSEQTLPGVRKSKKTFSLKEKVSTLKHNLILKGKLLGKKVQSVHKAAASEAPSLAMDLGFARDDYAVVPPSPASECSLHDDFFRPDHPSPVSTLEAPFVEDPHSSQVSTEFSTEFSALTSLPKERPEEDESIEDKANEKPHAMDETVEEEGHAKAYIKDILISSGLYEGEAFEGTLLWWDALTKPIPNWVFEEVEETYFKDGRRCYEERDIDHRMLFDLVNEALPRILATKVSCSSFKRWFLGPSTVPRGQKLVDVLLHGIQLLQNPAVDESHALDSLVSVDTKMIPWSNLSHDDVEFIGGEVELVILAELIDELVGEYSDK